MRVVECKLRERAPYKHFFALIERGGTVMRCCDSGEHESEDDDRGVRGRG
jgi:hypothetical protein